MNEIARTNFLLIEDDNSHAKIVFRIFSSELKNINLSRARDGQEALNLLRESLLHPELPFPDVVLLDLKLPKLNGFEFLKIIRNSQNRKLRSLPIVVLSSSDAPKDRKKASRLGASDYYPKPVGYDEFREILLEIQAKWKVRR